MDLSHVFKGSLVKVIGELRGFVSKEQFESAVRKFIPEGLDGIESFTYEPAKRKSDDITTMESKKQRVFDISKYRRRHIALRIFYDGSNMSGLAQHDSTQLLDGVAEDNSVETAIFAALKKVNLIDDITKCKYQRCGRTDAGVSAFNQVISLYLRSNLRSGCEFVDEYDSNIVYNPPSVVSTKGEVKEFDYPAVLNKVLPDNIRVTGWCPVDRDFSARFSCCGRVYRYYFMRRNYNIPRLQEALHLLEGEHDFRNFCRIDAINVCDFTRVIFRGKVVTVKKGDDPSHDVMAIEIIGRAFLWHQIRCIMSVLFVVAAEKEDLSIISDLLDVKKSPYKPQYQMADPEPLVLYDCVFNPGENAPDSATKTYYEVIRSSPLYKQIVDSNTKEEKQKYNELPCCFTDCLSEQALRELSLYGERKVYEQGIVSSRYQQLADFVKEENQTRWSELPSVIGDFKELKAHRYTPYAKRSKAREVYYVTFDIASYEDRIRSMGDNSLRKLQNRYEHVDLEKNEYIPDVIKEKLGKKTVFCVCYGSNNQSFKSHP